MQTTRKISITPRVSIGGEAETFTLIAGPCAIEDETTVMTAAEELKRVCEALEIPLVFKGSFDKANRSSIFSPRGVGLEEGLRILEKVKAELDLPVVTDVHETTQCPAVGQVVDLIQIPAFLARQTDLLVAAAKTGKAVNVKKGQFMAPDDMRNVAAKLTEAGNEKILFCERGTSFGYHTLVVDFTGLIEMRKIGFPIVFDATHSVQKPGGNGTRSGGNHEYAAPLMNAALAVGVDAIFAEVHPDPSRAISDAENQIPLTEIREILCRAKEIDRVARSFGVR
ncbi:MAG: 3-deoxy-8-phosphooctulonate synthase [Thermoguttaceae bacterium]|nr:3-deoxy-8-phosphooctulonate synthase [Thermoguttaceae bacterium]